MGWGASAPAPDPNIGLAENKTADLAQQQQNFYQTQIAPKQLAAMDLQNQTAQEQLAYQQKIGDFQMGMASQYNDRYNNTFVPLEDKVIAQAEEFNTPGYQELLAGRAANDVSQSAASANEGLQRNLASRGISSGSGNAIAAMAGSRDTEALGRATALNSTRLQAQQMGWNMMSGAAALGSGLPGASLGASSAASGSGMNSLSAASAGLSGIGTSAGISNQNAQTVGGMYSNLGSLGLQNWQTGVQAAQVNNGPINSIVGAATGALGAWGTGYLPRPNSDIRLKTDIKRVGQLDDGQPVYTYKYKADPNKVTHMGVMAHETAEAGKGDAVFVGYDGYFGVHYDKL